MNPFEMVFGLVLIGAIAGVLQTWLRSRTTRGGALPDADADGMRQELKTLRERVAVLERIATDRNHLLE